MNGLQQEKEIVSWYWIEFRKEMNVKPLPQIKSS